MRRAILACLAVLAISFSPPAAGDDALVIGLGDIGVLPGDMATLVFLAALGFVLVYVWFIARTALELPPVTCAAIVILDLALGILIMTISNSLY